jgi:hypothetical protein
MSQFTKNKFEFDESQRKGQLAHTQKMHNNYFDRVKDHSLSLNIKKRNNKPMDKYNIKKCIRTKKNIVALADSNKMYLLTGKTTIPV